jgi:hypothetical protein
VGFVVGIVALGHVLSYFGFPVAPQSPSSIIWGWYNRAIVAAVPSGVSLTRLRIIIIKKYLRSF